MPSHTVIFRPCTTACHIKPSWSWNNCQDAPPLHDLFIPACHACPAGNHVVLISRLEPPAALARLYVHGNLSRIGWDHLRLTDEEVGALTIRRGVTLTPEQATNLNARADGWAAGVRLMLEKPTQTQCLLAEDRSAPVLFAYFAAEVFARLTPAEQGILRHAALFPTTLTAAMVEALAGVDGTEGAEVVLARLVRAGWFTADYEGENRPAISSTPCSVNSCATRRGRTSPLTPSMPCGAPPPACCTRTDRRPRGGAMRC